MKVDDGACTMTLVGWSGGGEEEAEDEGTCSAVDSTSGFGWKKSSGGPLA